MNSERFELPTSSASFPISGVRIIEDPSPNVIRRHAELCALQNTVLRGLWIAFPTLCVCFVAAVVKHGGWLLCMLLWVLTASCVPLMLMVSQDIREVRR